MLSANVLWFEKAVIMESIIPAHILFSAQTMSEYVDVKVVINPLKNI